MERHFPIPPVPQEIDPELLRTNTVYLNLDWEAYYESFKDAHGEPVRWRGLLLFPDGWKYSAKSKEGPEFPPPTNPNELHPLQVCYWLTRLNMVQAERDLLRDIVRGLRALQRAKSQPLQQQTKVYDESTGKRRLQSQPVDVDGLEHGRLVWLEQDILDCQAQLRRLEHEQQERSLPT